MQRRHGERLHVVTVASRPGYEPADASARFMKERAARGYAGLTISSGSAPWKALLDRVTAHVEDSRGIMQQTGPLATPILTDD